LEYSLSFSAKGYGTFLKISALPIGISSLSIPLGVLIGRLHGTKQTALQISEAQATNRTNLYLAHYEHFRDHFGEIQQYVIYFTNKSRVYLDIKTLYRSLYPENNINNGVMHSDNKVLLHACKIVCRFDTFIRSNIKDLNQGTAERISIINGMIFMEDELKEQLPLLGFEVDENFKRPPLQVENIQRVANALKKVVLKSVSFDQGLESEKLSEYREKLLDALEDIASLGNINHQDKERLNDLWGATEGTLI
ncbi:hypothetical protein, partial [Salinivibrio sp. VYel6]|uniref:hypothetical protein n=1 Tax=Salinivibrio sp. VYel6 TaxID=2490493 RepID=UPI001562280E